MSLAEDNVAAVRRGYDAFNTADMTALTEIFDENASWHTPGRAIGGDYAGREAVFGQFGRYAGETGGTFKAALQDVFAAADGRVVGLHHNSAERGGKQLDVDCCIVFEIKDGRLIDGREFFGDLHAWEGFWS